MHNLKRVLDGLDNAVALQATARHFESLAKNLRKQPETEKENMNMNIERVFGYWDNKQWRIPALSSIAVEACVLFTLNKTLAWFEAKPEAEKEQLIRFCQRQTPDMKAKFKERAEQLLKELQARLEKKQVEKMEKEKKEMSKKLALMATIESLSGLWVNERQMNAGMQRI